MCTNVELYMQRRLTGVIGDGLAVKGHVQVAADEDLSEGTAEKRREDNFTGQR
jgi:hypothetical protein